MATVRDIMQFIDSFVPFSSQMKFDNAGINIGNPDAKVKKAVLALDITPKVIECARECGANLIISHHPVLFHATKQIYSDSVPYLLARYGMTALCCHTNFDFCKDGVADTLASLLNLQNVEDAIEEDGKFVARIGETDKECTGDEFATSVRNALSLTAITYTPTERMIKRVAVIPGGGGEYIDAAIAAGADAFVTGDVKHHQLLAAHAAGVCLVMAGHYATEAPSMSVLLDKLSAQFDDVLFMLTEIDNPVKMV